MYKFICSKCGKVSQTMTKRKVCYICAYNPTKETLLKLDIDFLRDENERISHELEELTNVVRHMSDYITNLEILDLDKVKKK